MKLRFRIVFLMVFLFMFSSVCVYADYDITSKYQKTEFNSSKWIQAYHNISLDELSGSLYLSKYYSNSSLNPTDFTIVGAGITTNNTSVKHEYDRQETSYCYYDYGVNYFIPDKEVIIDFKFKEASVNKFRHWVSIGLTNDLAGFSKISGYELLIRHYLDNSGEAVSLRELNNGGLLNVDTNISLPTDVFLYGTFKLDSNYALLYIYNDVLKTNLLDLLNITLENDDYSYRYMYIAQSSDEDAGTPTKSLGISEDYILKIRQYNDSGVLYTNNLLENVTQQSVMLGLNSSAAADTQSLLYASSDNVTWIQLINNNGLGTLSQYSEVLYDYSSLFVRLNLSTVDPLLSPYVDELFYFHTYECAVSSETKPYVFIILFTIIGMILGYAIDRA